MIGDFAYRRRCLHVAGDAGFYADALAGYIVNEGLDVAVPVLDVDVAYHFLGE